MQEPEIGSFQLVVDSVEQLRQLVAQFSEPELPVVGSKRSRASARDQRKRCERELHDRLELLLKELEPWEQKLIAAQRKARIKMRREMQNYVEKVEEVSDSAPCNMKTTSQWILSRQVKDVWASEESNSDEEGEAEEAASASEETDSAESGKTSKSPSISGPPAEAVEEEKVEGLGVSARGRLRKRRIIPNNVEDQGMAKKRWRATPKPPAPTPGAPQSHFTWEEIAKGQQSGLYSIGMVQGRPVLFKAPPPKNKLPAPSPKNKLPTPPPKSKLPSAISQNLHNLPSQTPVYRFTGSPAQQPQPTQAAAAAMIRTLLTAQGKLPASRPIASVTTASSQRLPTPNIAVQPVRPQSSTVTPVASVRLPSPSISAQPPRLQPPPFSTTPVMRPPVAIAQPAKPPAVPATSPNKVPLQVLGNKALPKVTSPAGVKGHHLSPGVSVNTIGQLPPAVIQQLLKQQENKLKLESSSGSPRPKYATNVTVKELLLKVQEKPGSSFAASDAATTSSTAEASTKPAGALPKEPEALKPQGKVTILLPQQQQQQPQKVAVSAASLNMLLPSAKPLAVKQQAIDKALKAVMTTVNTTLPTAQIKVLGASPLQLPTRQPHRHPVTMTTTAMKGSIPVVPELSSEGTKPPAPQAPVAVSSSAAPVIADPQKTLALKVTPRSFMTPDGGMVQGIVLPPGVTLPPKVLQQMSAKKEDGGQGLYVLRQNADGTLHRILPSVSATAAASAPQAAAPSTHTALPNQTATASLAIPCSSAPPPVAAPTQPAVLNHLSPKSAPAAVPAASMGLRMVAHPQHPNLTAAGDAKPPQQSQKMMLFQVNGQLVTQQGIPVSVSNGQILVHPSAKSILPPGSTLKVCPSKPAAVSSPVSVAQIKVTPIATPASSQQLPAAQHLVLQQPQALASSLQLTSAAVLQPLGVSGALGSGLVLQQQPQQQPVIQVIRPQGQLLATSPVLQVRMPAQPLKVQSNALGPQQVQLLQPVVSQLPNAAVSRP